MNPHHPTPTGDSWAGGLEKRFPFSKTLGKTEFKNYTADVFEPANPKAQGVTHVRLVFPDVHEISFQKKANGFVFLRELEIQGTPAQ